MTEDRSICMLCGEPVELSIHGIWTMNETSGCCWATPVRDVQAGPSG